MQSMHSDEIEGVGEEWVHDCDYHESGEYGKGKIEDGIGESRI